MTVPVRKTLKNFFFLRKYILLKKGQLLAPLYLFAKEMETHKNY